MLKRRYLLFFITLYASVSCAQVNNGKPRFYIGPSIAANFSKVGNGDTFAANFSRRNHLGISGGFEAMYDLSPSSSLIFGARAVTKGYKISNDTLSSSVGMLNRRVFSLVVPFGLSLRQKFNSSNYIKENFGVALNWNFVKDSTVLLNSPSNAAYKVVETSINKIYPMFFLGLELGGNTDNGNRYSFGVKYFQSFAKDASINVGYGENLAKKFPLNYRGGFLEVGFTYYFNLQTIKKSKSDWIYD